MEVNNAKMKHIIVGAGEVGKALHEVLKTAHEVALRDKDNTVSGIFGVMHIAYPPMERFVEITQAYMQQYQPKLVIIHSTVPVGTTRTISPDAVHSPIRGVHPKLAEGIRTFVKYFGGTRAQEAAKLFAAAGVPTQAFAKPETTELIKILDTTYYGWNIVFNKEAKRICDGLGLDFDEVYTLPNTSYNEGYVKLSMGHVVRPVLKHVPGKIGGHCVVQNCNLLESLVTRIIKEQNERY